MNNDFSFENCWFDNYFFFVPSTDLFELWKNFRTDNEDEVGDDE